MSILQIKQTSKHLLLGLLLSGLYSASVTADIVINQLSDFSFTTTPAAVGDLQATNSVCVGLRPNGRFSLTALGSGAGSSFTIRSGPYTLPYRLFFSDRNNRGFQELTPGVTLSNLRGVRRQASSGTCRQLRARIQILIERSNLVGLPSGVYQGTATLTVVPE